MAKPGPVPRSVILLVVLLAQFCPRTLKSVSAARYAPAVGSHDHEETGRTWGASFVPRDIGAAGWKLERRLSDDREELSTHGAAHEDTGNQSVQVKTNGRPLGPHGYHHHPCRGNGWDGQSGSENSGRKDGDGGGCEGRQGRQGGRGGKGDGLESPSRDGKDGRYGGDGKDGCWAKCTYAKRSQKFSIPEGNGGNENGPSSEFGPAPRPVDCHSGGSIDREFISSGGPSRELLRSAGPGDGRPPGGGRLGHRRPGDGRPPGGGRLGHRQPGPGRPGHG